MPSMLMPSMPNEFLDEKEKKVLELNTRREIYLLIKKFAGTHFREIERISRHPTGIVRYHLDYLTRHGLINEVKSNNNLRYFPKSFSSDNQLLLGLLRQESIRKILLCIIINNSCMHEQLTAFVKVSPSTISWHLKKLKENNIIGFSTLNGKIQYHLLVSKEEIVNLLITYKETFFDAMVDRVIEMWLVLG